MFTIKAVDGRNTAYVSCTKGGTVTCVLANGRNASLFYAGVPDNRIAETRIRLARCAGATSALNILKEVGTHEYSIF